MSRSATVVFVSSHSSLGGSESVLAQLVEEIPDPQVSGIVALQDGPLIRRLATDGRRVAVIDTAGTGSAMLRSAVRLARHLRHVRPEVVHANGVKAALISVVAVRLAAPLRPLPVVWMKHDVSLDGWGGRLLAGRCAAVVGVSHEVLTGLGAAGHHVVVHPGVRVVAPDEAEVTRFRNRNQVAGPTVTVLGRLDPAKGHQELVEVLPQLVARIPGVTALLVGSDDAPHPETRERIAHRARDLGVSGHVRLLRHEPSAVVIAASDVVCIPTVPRSDGSGREGFGLVAAEAMALGVPVAGYDVGATAEVLGGAGALVPQGDRKALADEIARLLLDRSARRDAVDRGLGRAAELTVARSVEDMLQLYEEVAR